MDSHRTLELLPLIEFVDQQNEIEAALIANVTIKSQKDGVYILMEKKLTPSQHNASVITTMQKETLTINEAPVSFTCSCRISQSNQNRRSSHNPLFSKPPVFCRHMVFLFATVAKIYDHYFYNKKRSLYRHELQMLMGVVNPPYYQTTTSTVITSEFVATKPSIASTSTTTPALHRDCPICLDDLTDKATTMQCGYCCKSYHANCVSQWMTSSRTCPCCRHIEPFQQNTRYCQE